MTWRFSSWRMLEPWWYATVIIVGPSIAGWIFDFSDEKKSGFVVGAFIASILPLISISVRALSRLWKKSKKQRQTSDLN